MATNPFPAAPDASPPPPVVGDPLTVLDRYETALAGFRAGLVDLEASPSYLMLTSGGLGSVTAHKVGTAPAGAGALWPLLDGLEAALGEIRRYRDEHGAAGRHRDELVRLLTERWVPVELGSAGAGAGAGARGRVSPTLLSVAEALDGFRRRYDAIRGWVTQINDLFLELLPRIDAARVTLDRLDAEVAALGVPEPLIGRARALADDIRTRLVDDPLALTVDDGPRLDDAVTAAASQVTSLRAGHDRLDDDLGTTEELLASLRVLRARSEAAGSEARAKVVDPEGVVRVPSTALLDGPGGLAERLDAITGSTTNSWSQRRALLDSWLATARRLEAQLQRAEEANRRPLAQREELRGRLRAYQAKIAAVGRAEDLDLTAVADRARSELFTAPTDLARAAAAIDELARRLRT